jgi:NAD(P)H-quinone oxidoreductase subunit 5
MQLSQFQSINAPARVVAGILWLGLGAAGPWILAEPTVTPASGLPLTIGILNLFVAAIIATFSLGYMRADGRSTRYFVTLVALVVPVLAFLFTGNLIILAAAWYMGGQLLAGLIGHAATGRNPMLQPGARGSRS